MCDGHGELVDTVFHNMEVAANGVNQSFGQNTVCTGYSRPDRRVD